jgi:hypothetical protein
MLIFLLYPSSVFSGNYETKKKGEKMADYHIFSQKNGKFFLPYAVPTKYSIEKIFPVPVKNAVGTIDIKNQITIINFKGDEEPHYDAVAKNFLSEVNGDFDFDFSNVYSDDQIAYTQTRWAVIANLKKGKVVTPVITMSLDNYSGGIACLDYSKNMFVVNKLIPAHSGYSQRLNIVKLEGDEFKLIGEVNAGLKNAGYFKKTPWIVQDKKLISFDDPAKKMECHDAEMKEVTHPFVEIFNRNNQNFRRLKDMVIHPTLPFGLIIEVGNEVPQGELAKLPVHSLERSKLHDMYIDLRKLHTLYLVRWDTNDTNKQYIPIFSKILSLLPPIHPNSFEEYGDLTISPDGKWLVFSHKEEKEVEHKFIGGRDDPFFIAVPIHEKYPLFFGEPVFLGRLGPKPVYETVATWATEPTALVAVNGRCICKWDLGNIRQATTVTIADTVYTLE